MTLSPDEVTEAIAEYVRQHAPEAQDAKEIAVILKFGPQWRGSGAQEYKVNAFEGATAEITR